MWLRARGLSTAKWLQFSELCSVLLACCFTRRSEGVALTCIFDLPEVAYRTHWCTWLRFAVSSQQSKMAYQKRMYFTCTSCFYICKMQHQMTFLTSVWQFIIQQCNMSFCRLFGFCTTDDVVGTNISQLVPSLDLPASGSLNVSRQVWHVLWICSDLMMYILSPYYCAWCDQSTIYYLVKRLVTVSFSDTIIKCWIE